MTARPQDAMADAGSCSATSTTKMSIDRGLPSPLQTTAGVTATQGVWPSLRRHRQLGPGAAATTASEGLASDTPTFAMVALG